MDEHVDFTAMKDGTREEYELLARLEKPYLTLTADRVLEELKRAGETTLEGYKITRLQHGLQSGTRALRDGAYHAAILNFAFVRKHAFYRQRYIEGCVKLGGYTNSSFLDSIFSSFFAWLACGALDCFCSLSWFLCNTCNTWWWKSHYGCYENIQ